MSTKSNTASIINIILSIAYTFSLIFLMKFIINNAFYSFLPSPLSTAQSYAVILILLLPFTGYFCSLSRRRTIEEINISYFSAIIVFGIFAIISYFVF